MAKRLFAATLSIVFMLCMAIGGLSAGEKMELTYWIPFSGGDGDFMLELINQYNKEQPDVVIKPLSFRAEEYYAKLRTAILSGRGPDVAVGHTSSLAMLTADKQAMPLDDMAKELNIDWNSFNQNILGACIIDGKHMALPLDTQGQVLFVNKAILGQAGLLNADGSFTIEPGADGFLKFLQQIKAKVPEAVPFSAPTEGLGGYWFWWTIYSQMDGKLLDKSGNLILDKAKAIAALDYMKSLQTDGVWPKATRGVQANEMFKTGKVATLWEGMWATGDFERTQGLDFTVIPVPHLFQKNVVWGDSHVLIIPMQRTPDAAKQKAGLTFANWLCDHGLYWSKAGHIPSKSAVATSAEFLSQKYRPNYVGVADLMSYLPATPKFGAIKDLLIIQVSGAMAEQFSSKEAADNMEEEIAEILAD